MKLFRYENYEVKIDPEALLLKPFENLAEKFKRNKEFLKSVFAYIYFFADSRSDFQIFRDTEERSTKIKMSLGIDEKWEPDDITKAAIDFYSSFKTESAMLLDSTKNAIDKLRKALEEINFNEVDDKGRPVYPLNTLAQTIKVIPTLVKDLKDAEEAVNSEIKSAAKARGGSEKTLFDDGINL